MPPKKKFRSGRSKKRRFAGNRYTVKKKKTENEASVDQESAEETEGSDTEENKWSLKSRNDGTAEPRNDGTTENDPKS